jgi:hypothetical protein
MSTSKEYNGPERRSNFMTATEVITAIHNECKAVNDRITVHKNEQNERFDKLDSRIDMLVALSEKRTEELNKVKALLITDNGEAGAIPRIVALENKAKEHDDLMKKVTTLIWGSATALVLAFIGWLGKAVLFLSKTIGG